jgi:hypothetical protein
MHSWEGSLRRGSRISSMSVMAIFQQLTHSSYHGVTRTWLLALAPGLVWNGGSVEGLGGGGACSGVGLQW